MKKVLVLAGTRPEVIKIAPVLFALRERRQEFNAVFCTTGQHRNMLDQALAVFGLKPDLDLNLMTPDQTLAGLTGNLFRAIDETLVQVKPDIMLVQGDTTSAMVGAMSGFYRDIPVGHIEAGLRTGNLQAPFPEESNRCIIGRHARWHFAPTEGARRNLLSESVPESRIEVTGNTVVDALHWAQRHVEIKPGEDIPLPVVASLKGRRMLLVTGHRRESFGESLAGVCRALKRLADAFEDVVIVYPVHLNPKVQEPVQAGLGGHPRIHLLPPVSYSTMLWLMRESYSILSDSGGIQEEAPSFAKPLLITRETTERPEVVEAGCALLVGTDEQVIFTQVERLLMDSSFYASMTNKVNPFGDGRASARIVACLQGTSNSTSGVGFITE